MGGRRCAALLAALAGLAPIAVGSRADEPAPEVLCREGAQLGHAELLRLRAWLPVELWRLREVFFHPGMRMQLGPCHRRYPEPASWSEATRRHAGEARLDAQGNLSGHRAGLPFPPESIDAAAPDAAARWAWNLERRYRGAGPRGRFRLVDLPGERGGVQTYHGELFQLLRPEPDVAWIAGGRFDAPQELRHLAWRQTRPSETERRFALADELFVYRPDERKLRRAPAAWHDGLFVPRPGGGALGGFEALSLRPNAYVWRWRGEQQVLAPTNVVRPGWPEDPERRFGPGGLSAGSERWELRRAVRIEGALREGGREHDRLELWIDAQTAQPLYWIARRRDGGLVGVGVLLHRFSGDRPGYPALPDGSPALVFDPVAALVHRQDGGGWRRESYDLVSTPPDADTLRRLTQPGGLERGR